MTTENTTATGQEITHKTQTPEPARELTPLVDGPAGDAQRFLRGWASSMADAGYLAKSLAVTSLTPKHLAGDIPATALTIMRGASLGLDPITAMESIYVVSGKPALYSRAMHSLVLQAGHDVWVESASDTEVTVCGRRAGSDHVQTFTWTIDRAKRAGYTSNRKYESEPQAMLRSKAIAEACRTVAPEALLGLNAVEDLEDVEQAATVTVTRKPRKTKIAPPEPEEVQAEIIEPEAGAQP